MGKQLSFNYGLFPTFVMILENLLVTRCQNCMVHRYFVLKYDGRIDKKASQWVYGTHFRWRN